MQRVPLILLGAGLASTLIAQRLSQRADAPEILVVEKNATPHGRHTWSFHASDVSPQDHAWIAPLVGHRWSAQAVRFPQYWRRLASPYLSLTGESVSRQMARLSNVSFLTSARALGVRPDGVELADGRRIAADCVIDARGFEPHPSLTLGWQAFVGLEVDTHRPHGVVDPLIMDADVDQAEGYHFFYVLPFSPTRLLIEDTVYADRPTGVVGGMDARVARYAAAQGWSIRRVLRRESGVLPIALAFDARSFWAARPDDVPQAGLRAGLFHPTTGYTLPEAVRVANLVDAAWPTGSAALASTLRAHALERAREQRFYRLLSRMLFRAAPPEKRYLMLQRFYRLPLPLIERFYAGRTTILDGMRILGGKPPVPIGRALSLLVSPRAGEGAGE